MKARRIGTAIFCDDIRHEIGNKISIVGVYDAEMVFEAGAPVLVPKLACYLTIVSEVDDVPKDITFRIIIPSENSDGMEIVRHQSRVGGPAKNLEGAKNIYFRFFIEMSQVLLTQPGFIEAWADADGESFRCGRVLVVFPEKQNKKA